MSNPCAHKGYRRESDVDRIVEEWGGEEWVQYCLDSGKSASEIARNINIPEHAMVKYCYRKNLKKPKRNKMPLTKNIIAKPKSFKRVPPQPQEYYQQLLKELRDKTQVWEPDININPEPFDILLPHINTGR